MPQLRSSHATRLHMHIWHISYSFDVASCKRFNPKGIMPEMTRITSHSSPPKILRRSKTTKYNQHNMDQLHNYYKPRIIYGRVILKHPLVNQSLGKMK